MMSSYSVDGIANERPILALGLGRDDDGRGYDTVRASKRKLTPRDRIRLIAVLATISAAVASVALTSRARRQRSQRLECGNYLRQVSLAVTAYEDQYGVFPPTNVEDEQGRPLLSWRVPAVNLLFNYDFGSRVDFSQPWDSPTNSRIFDSLDMVYLQCPSSEVTKPGITHYVAVTGPGTLWENKGGSKRPESDKRILVIEWPESDIHWSEPRDITLDQLLDWLKSKSETNHPECLLYVDGSGEVGELPIDSDPETVRRVVIGEPPPTPTTPKSQP